MSDLPQQCPDCDAQPLEDSNGVSDVSRRRFLKTASAGAAAVATASLVTPVSAKPNKPAAQPESLVESLYKSMNESQRSTVCFDWDHQDKKRGLLRTFVANNWNITKAEINSDFYTDEQRDIIQKVFEGIIHRRVRTWISKIFIQLCQFGVIVFIGSTGCQCQRQRKSCCRQQEGTGNL